MTGIIAERPRFVDGMLLSAEDLTLEQHYVDRRLLQVGPRFGKGVVSGLEAHLEGDMIIINRGCAIDAAGREIVFAKKSTEKAATGILCVRWDEPKKRNTSAIGRASATSSDAESVIRAIAKAKIKVIVAQEFEQALVDDWVPIADIDIDEQRVTRIARLAGISKVSWKHGESKTIVPENLWIEFSAPVKSFPPQALDIRVRSGAAEKPALLKSFDANSTRTRFAFEIESGRIGDEGATVFIRLACDFVLDLKDDPVSGAHLGGTLSPNGSGNGVPGGVFESWFFIDGLAK